LIENPSSYAKRIKVEKSADVCPGLMIACYLKEPCCGKKRIFGFGIAGGYKDREPTFKWSVSSGKIVKGQGTGVIEVDATEAIEPLEVSLEVGEIIPPDCSNIVKKTFKCPEDCDSIPSH
jgi:hypothetical protein